MNEAAETALTVPEMIEKALATYSPSDAAIAEMRANYLPLVVTGEDDKAGYVAVRAARLEVKAKRIAVEKCRVGLKEGALRYGQAVDAEARRLTKALELIEAHLQAQEDIVVQAAERRRQAEEAAALARLRQRMAALADAESRMLPEDVRGMTDEQFAAALAIATSAKAARIEAERVAAEQRKAEADRLSEARAALEQARREEEARQAAARSEQAAEARRLADARAVIEAVQREQQRQADIKAAEERARVQAAEDSKREAERQAAEAARRAAAPPLTEREALLLCKDALAAILAWHDWKDRDPPADESGIPPAALRSLPSLLAAGRGALASAASASTPASGVGAAS